MALRDYEAMDEDDYYGQPFEAEGFVSIWVATGVLNKYPAELEPLQDWCGVGYYDVDSHEQNHAEYKAVPIAELLTPLSYSPSFQRQALEEARRRGISTVTWVMAQYDFAYQPSAAKRPVSDVVTFLGAFRYSK